MSIACPICDNENYILGCSCDRCGHQEDASLRGFTVFEVEEVMQDA